MLRLESLIRRLNETTRSALELAARECLARGHYELEIEHLLLELMGMEGSDASLILEHFGVGRQSLGDELKANMKQFRASRGQTPALSVRVRMLLRDAWCIASLNLDSETIRSGHILLALAASDDLRWATPDELLRIDGNRLEREFDSVVRASLESGGLAKLHPSAAVKNPPRPRDISVFLSYRREDGEAYAGRLYDLLERELGSNKVFLDVDQIEPGEVFASILESRVSSCDVLIAIIGKRWLRAKDGDGTRRLDQDSDWVRKELALALERGRTVVPCLVGGAKMPELEDLPPELAGLARHQALEISQKTFKRDTNRLVQLLKRLQAG